MIKNYKITFTKTEGDHYGTQITVDGKNVNNLPPSVGQYFASMRSSNILRALKTEGVRKLEMVVYGDALK